jgi:hypothetical protein
MAWFGRNIALGLGVVLTAAISAIVVVYNLTVVREPTTDEYLVYSSLVHHLADEDLFAKKQLAVINQTSKLTLPNYYLTAQPPIPAELRIHAIDDLPFADFKSFCGRCAKDFAKKNLNSWALRPTAELLVLDATQPQIVGKNVARITVSRVGFDLWHTRAVLAFEADCSDAEKSLMCLEIGKASLKKENGRWTVEQLLATTF